MSDLEKFTAHADALFRAREKARHFIYNKPKNRSEVLANRKALREFEELYDRMSPTRPKRNPLALWKSDALSELMKRISRGALRRRIKRGRKGGNTPRLNDENYYYETAMDMGRRAARAKRQGKTMEFDRLRQRGQELKDMGRNTRGNTYMGKSGLEKFTAHAGAAIRAKKARKKATDPKSRKGLRFLELLALNRMEPARTNRVFGVSKSGLRKMAEILSDPDIAKWT